MRLAIFGRLTANTNLDQLGQFFDYLHCHRIPFSIHHEYAEELAGLAAFAPHHSHLASTFSEMREVAECDYLFSLGGDGTLLDAIRYIGHLEIPIVGVNFGRLGFLASGQQEDLLSITDGLRLGSYKLDTRKMIQVDSNPALNFGGHNVGLNEVTLHKANSNEMIVIHTYINGEFLNTYWADGLIISTPTGSTAYSLACGGPIMMPSADVFVLTPIAPHSLTVRPFIVPDNAVVSFELESRSGQALVAVDSRTELVNTQTVEIAIRRAPTLAKLVKVNAPSYFSTLRTRLNWGRDTRN